jgi:hypothetical protein
MDIIDRPRSGRFIGLAGWIALLFFLPVAIADPFLYRFSGQVSEILHDQGGMIAASGLTLGSPVEYRFLVDFDQPGIVTHFDGTTEVLEDLPRPGEMGNLTAHFFYAELLSGNVIKDPAAEQLRPPGGTLRTQHGMSSTDPASRLGVIVQGGVNYRISIAQQEAVGGIFLPTPPLRQLVDSPFVVDWKIGEQMTALGSALNASGQESAFFAEVTLNEITAVPEPRVITLMILSLLLGVTFIRREQRS